MQGRICQLVFFYYDLEKYDEAYKYFDTAYNDAGYYPFSIEDKKYWQFYKQRKDELNPKKKPKVRFDIFRRPLPNRHQYHRPRRLHHQLRLQRPMAVRNHYRHLQYDSYELFVQVRNWTTKDGENRQQTYYFHYDKIGIPREMTDKDGNLLWFGNYTG